MAASTVRQAGAWALLSTLTAYLLQGIPALGWFALNQVRVGPQESGPPFPFPAYFWTDPVWVGSLLLYGVVIFAFGVRGMETRRVITASVVATLGYLVVVAVLPATWVAQADWPLPTWVQVLVLAAVIHYNGWILFLAPVVAWRIIRAVTLRQHLRPYNRMDE